MTTVPLRVAMQFDDAGQQRLAASLGMWTFLATEVLFFGGLFAGYSVYRYWYPVEWEFGSRRLDLLWGAINTAVLLTSSLTVALAVSAAETGHRRRLRAFLLATLLLGGAFVGVKWYEYLHKWHEGLVPGSGFAPHFETAAGVQSGPLELFFTFYFVMTGCHAAHMLIGMAIMLALVAMTCSARGVSPTVIENFGLYWHFVDIVWVFLFPLLYLIDRT